VRCSVVQCVAVCAVCCSVLQTLPDDLNAGVCEMSLICHKRMIFCDARLVLVCVVVRGSILQCVAECCVKCQSNCHETMIFHYVSERDESSEASRVQAGVLPITFHELRVEI